MTPEAFIKKDIDIYLKSLGNNWWGFKPMMLGYGRKGIPDIVGCYYGHFVALEVKSEKGVATEWQRREMDAIRNSRGICWEVRSVDDVKELFWENFDAGH